MFHPYLRTSLAALLLLASANTVAGISLSHTRLIFEGQRNDVSITLGNATTRPYAVQTWVNTEADDNSLAAPFIATPPLFRLEGRKEQLVRVVRTGNIPVTDRESVFYFNAQEIPAASAEDNVLKVALRTRIKLFYRPAGLKGSLLDALPTLSWSWSSSNGKSMLRVDNPSAFHVSFIDIQIGSGKQRIEVAAPMMVAPFSHKEYPVTLAPGAHPDAVYFSAINDHGGYTEPARVDLPTLAR
ncbi:fimbrial biogenesis chaperone [Pseudomonas sp. TE3610]